MPLKALFDVISATADEISFAPMGHNQRKYLLVKGETMDSKALKKLLSKDDEELTEILEKAGLSGEGLEAGELVGRLLKAYGDELPEGFLSIMAKASGLDEPEGGDDGDGDGAGAGMKKAKEGAGAGTEGKGAAKTPARGDSVEDALLKAPAELQPLLRQMLKATADAESRANAAEEKATRLEKASEEKYFSDLMANLAGLPGDLGTLKKALMTINPSFPVEVGVITSTLKKAALLESKGGLKQKGRDGPGESMNKAGSAVGEIDRLTEKMRKAEGGEMSKAEAMARVIEENPELYDRYVAEMEVG